jgi:anti-sigma regulatory factor (Ser/Thr protein kinase)
VTTSTPTSSDRASAFRHEALLYAGLEEFLQAATAFVCAGVAAGEPVLVATPAERLAPLQRSLRDVSGSVLFLDMLEAGRNPARIIPLWRDFVKAHGGRRARGIGEPIWAGRSPAELSECQRHEALLNLAFADVEGFHLLCPYDVGALRQDVIDEAHRSHPMVACAGRSEASAGYDHRAARERMFDGPLPEPLSAPSELAFDIAALAAVRRFVAACARDAGVSGSCVSDLVLAMTELATNSIRHGGGRGVMRAWREHGALLLEVRDDGRIAEPMVGRIRPTADQLGGFGLWMVNQLCDLVQVRSSAEGSVVRVHVRP